MTNQLMRLNDHLIAYAIEQKVPLDAVEAMHQRWKEMIGDEVRLVIFPETRLVASDGKVVFEFTGDITPEVVEAFRRWWREEVSSELPVVRG